MHFTGFFIGLSTFVLIGLFHPLVIKGEYYFGSRIWPVFLVAGILLLAASVLVSSVPTACLLGILGFTCLWSIGELKEQEVRVRKGWYPQNPRRKEP